MHITVLGAGVLGRVYGLRLAAAGSDVSFLVRSARATETAPFIIEQVNGAARRDVIDHPDRVTAIPPRTSAILVAVRFDQLEAERGGAAYEELLDRLRAAPAVPIVMLTPILPKQRAALEQAIGRKITPAMPSVSGYLDERDVARYWLVRVASTLLDEPQSSSPLEARPALEDLARRLTKAGIPAHLERDVATLNAATTTAFFPFIVSIDAANGIDAVLADKQLFAIVLDAAKEADALARHLGKIAPWAHLLTRFIGPYTLKPAVVLGRKLFPEALRFVEVHFGRKLQGQHIAMGEAILDLGREHVIAMPALEKLVGMVREHEKEAA